MTFIAVTVDPDVDADPAQVQAMCQAVDVQAREFADAWGVPYTPVVFFSADVLEKLDGAELTEFVSDARLLTIQTSLDAPGALGYHDDVLGVIFARVLWQGDETSITLSHEVLEEIGDPTCDVYAPLGEDTEQALEACDRVEGDSYRSAGVLLSNYLLPAAFQPDSAGPWDKLGVLAKWNGMSGGGYTIVRGSDGATTDVFAETDHARARADRKMGRPDSRLSRRLAARPAALEAPQLPDKVSGKSPRRKRA